MPDARKQADGWAEPIKRGRARLADLILLVIPAFEAVRYAAVHETALRCELANHYEPPPLLSIDHIDGRSRYQNGFPRGEIHQQLVGIQHELSSEGSNDKNTWPYGGLPEPQARQAGSTYGRRRRESLSQSVPAWQETGVELQQDNWGRHFMTKPEFAKDPDGLKAQSWRTRKQRELRGPRLENASWMTGAPRHMCGGLVLMRSSNAEKQEFPVHLPNLEHSETSEHVIPDHSNFMTPAFFNFVKQLYSDRLRAAAGPK